MQVEESPAILPRPTESPPTRCAEISLGFQMLEQASSTTFAVGGDPGRTRTCNHRLRRSVLYPVELRGRTARRRVSGSRRSGGRRRSCRRSRSAAGCAGAASARRPRRRCRAARHRRPPPRGVAKRSRTWLFMSSEPVQPISGSIQRGVGRHELEHPVAGLGLARLHGAAARAGRSWRACGAPHEVEPRPLIANSRGADQVAIAVRGAGAGSGSSSGCEGARGGVGVRTRTTTTLLLALPV